MATELIRRTFETKELRAEGGDGKPTMLVGHALVFDVLSEDLGWFREKIAPGATRESIPRDDIRALFNHDSNFILGRNRAGTLRLKEDSVGLAVEIDPPDTQVARDLATSIKRGDVTQMSFGFIAEVDEWDMTTDPYTRTLKKIRLYDVSPVTFPAYPQTDISARSAEARASADRWMKEHPVQSRVIRQYKRRLRLALAS